MQLIIDIRNTQPRYPIYLTVYPDGKALVSSGADLYEVGVKTLGEHGRLIDRSHILDKVKDEWRKIREEKGYDVMSDFWLALCKVVEEVPIVLEATK